MSTGPRIEVHGEEEVMAGLARMGELAEDLTRVHTAVVAGLLPQIAARTPRDTGRLADGWGSEGERDRGRITSDVEYAGPVEYGVPARGIMPAAMIADTLAASEDEIRAEYLERLEAEARSIGFRTVRR